MSRFSQALDYMNTTNVPPVSIETAALGNKTMSTLPMSSQQSAALDTYSQGLPLDNSIYAAPQNSSLNSNLNDIGQLPPAFSPDPPQYGTSGTFPADPYAFSSQASSALNPSAMQMPNTSAPAAYPPPSPAFSDPYAPGGALASPAPQQPLSSKPKSSFRSSLDKLHSMKNNATIETPKALPNWIKWLSIAVLLGIIGAVIYRLAKSDSNPAPTPRTPVVPSPIICPPPVACPQKACPPVAPCPDKEMVVRLSKGEPTIKVKLVEHDHHGHEDDHKCSHKCENTANDSTAKESRGDKPSSPVVIVNELPRTQEEVLVPVHEIGVPKGPVPQTVAPEVRAAASADSWGLTYAGSGTALPRISDTNMVYTQIGGAF